MAQDAQIVWAPQPGPQKALIDCPLPCILYGGARGGGKTDGVLGKFALKSERYPKFNGVFFRQEMPQQDDLIDRAKEIFLPLGAKWHEQKKMFECRRGGRLRFRPLETTDDAGKYQGQNLTDAAVEEAGNYADSAPIDRLFGCLRSSDGVPIQLILTANPGGAGHQWIKRRFVDPAPAGMQVLTRELPNGAKHHYVYIPSRVQNNAILLANDPGYVDRLYLTGTAELVRAWLNGDWSVIEGAYFSAFRPERHVIRPFLIPDHWLRFRCYDHGSYRPFCCLWAAVSDGSIAPYPKGALIVYREYYGASSPNKGLKMRNPSIAEAILAKTPSDEQIAYSVADPAIWQEDGGVSAYEDFRLKGLNFNPGDNKRLPGWAQISSRLIGEQSAHCTHGLEIDAPCPTCKPMLYIFSTCSDLIRTLPALQHDEHRPEDVDSDGEDHAADALRYGCMSRPWVVAPIAKPPPIISWDEATMAQIIAHKFGPSGQRRAGRI